jgi:aldose 1-epimerase
LCIVWLGSAFVAGCSSSSSNQATTTDSGADSTSAVDSGSDAASNDSGTDASSATTDAATDGSSTDGGATYVVLDPAKFQEVTDAGQTIGLYTIKNSKGMSVSITNYGSKIEQILVPDRNGVFGDVVLGYDNIQAVMTGQASMGAFIGRYANRIAGTPDGGGQFTLDGVQYTLGQNDGTRPNTLHGGPKGSRFQVFQPTNISQSSIEMDFTFQQNVDNFPGSLALKVVYTVDDTNQLTIAYSATAGAMDTVGNFTQHPFFNLSGNLSSPALGHVVTLNANSVLEINANLIPTGVVRPVAGTPMDFTTPKAIGLGIPPADAGADAGYDLIELAGGYDNTFVINQGTGDGGADAAAEAGAGAPIFNAKVYEPTSGRTLEIWSTEPSVQLFSANNLAGQIPRDQGKGGAIFNKYGAVAVEPMHYPDSPNEPSFPTTVIPANATYTGQIAYKFGTQP